jgi:hypothetical protein
MMEKLQAEIVLVVGKWPHGLCRIEQLMGYERPSDPVVIFQQ